MFHKGWWLVHYFFTEIYVIFFIDTSSDIANYGWYCEKLTHFQPVFRFYTPWKHEKTGGFLMFSGGGGGYRSRTLVENELIDNMELTIRKIFDWFKYNSLKANATKWHFFLLSNKSYYLHKLWLLPP